MSNPMQYMTTINKIVKDIHPSLGRRGVVVKYDVPKKG